MMLVCFLAAQVALAAGGLALLRAWRLRRVPVISAADAAILNRRAAVGLVCGAITMTALPLTHFVVGADLAPRSDDVAIIVGPALIALLLALLPDALRATRLRPTREGLAGDLRADLGAGDARLTPWRIAVIVSGVIMLVMVAIGLRSHDLYDGILRGLFDAPACLLGFALLGQ